MFARSLLCGLALLALAAPARAQTCYNRTVFKAKWAIAGGDFQVGGKSMHTAIRSGRPDCEPFCRRRRPQI
jgi:hypothetical protein